MLSATQASLRMRCDIQRPGTGDDPFGGGSSFVTVASNVRCLWWTRSGRENVDDTRTVVLADEHLLVAHGVDVEPNDRIVGLIDTFGREVFGPDGFREVEHVTFARDHLDCALRSSS